MAHKVLLFIYMAFAFDTLVSPPTSELSHDAVFEASEHAYGQLVERGYPETEVHRMSLCYDAAALMVDKLTGQGFTAEHQIYASPEAGEHSYISGKRPGKDELIGDATWQQFLPVDARNASMPKALVGTRQEVTSRALAYGVKPEAAAFWLGTLTKRSPEEHREANAEAELAAERAADAGRWEKFMAARY